MVKNDILDNKFIHINMVILSRASSLIKNKKRMKEYAEELDWELDTKKVSDETGEIWYQILIKPKQEKISPSELSEKRDLIFGFLQDLIYYLYEGCEELPKHINSATHTIGTYKDKNKKEFVGIKVNIVESALEIFFDVPKGIILEKEYPELFKKIFCISIKKWYDDEIKIIDKRFCKSDERKRAKTIIEYLEKAGVNKKGIRKIKRFDFG